MASFADGISIRLQDLCKALVAHRMGVASAFEPRAAGAASEDGAKGPTPLWATSGRTTG